MTFTFYIHFVHFIPIELDHYLLKLYVYVFVLLLCKVYVNLQKREEDATDLDLDQISIEKNYS